MMSDRGISTWLALAILFVLLTVGSWAYFWVSTPEEEQVNWINVAKETYENPDENFSFDFPANWEKLEETQSKIEFGIENQEEEILVGVEVKWKNQFPEAGTPENYAATRADAVEELIKVSGGELIYDRRIYDRENKRGLEGLTAYEIVWWMKSGEMEVKSKDLHVVKGGSVYSINTHVLRSEYWEWSDVFDGIIQSLKLT